MQRQDRDLNTGPLNSIVASISYFTNELRVSGRVVELAWLVHIS